ncbi:MAG: hypothetical protein JSS12_04275 [Verrucomicrobia bacterium]|nr:hypothetical protein [Verrucomicrobiota bacterium]
MPNFAYPAYFFPYNNSGVYDFLGNTNAPFKPYKGTQFFMYQEQVYGDASELQTGVVVSSPKTPCNNWFALNGSIYDYASWGGLGGADLFSTRIQYNAAQFDIYFDKTIMNGNVSLLETASYEKKKFNKEEPQLFPFQYIDSCGDVVTRFRYINFIPDRLPPDQVDQAIKLLEVHMENSYLPYWGIKAEIKQHAIYSDKDLPVFDGTFIPFFYLRLSQFNLQKLGSGPIGGGAWNLCNVPHILTGPLLTDFIYDAPDLPLANPYLLVSEINFISMMGVTSLMSPKDAPSTVPPGTFRVRFENDALPLDLRNNNINLNYISNLGTSPSGGVNNLDGPDGVAFLGGGQDAFGPYWDFDLQALVSSPQVGFNFILEVVKKNSLEVVSDAIFLLPDQDAALRLEGSGDVLVTLSYDNMSYFSNVSAHEMEELCADPNYATFIATSNPPTDLAILFSQLEASDPVEGLSTLQPGKKKALSMDAMPIPAYFSASLRTNNYDNTGYISRALVPYSRQQIIWQQQGEPIQSGATFGPQPNLSLSTFGSIYDGGNFSYPIPPTTTPGFSGPVVDSPLSTIYESLLENKNL